MSCTSETTVVHAASSASSSSRSEYTVLYRLHTHELLSTFTEPLILVPCYDMPASSMPPCTACSRPTASSASVPRGEGSNPSCCPPQGPSSEPWGNETTGWYSLIYLPTSCSYLTPPTHPPAYLPTSGCLACVLIMYLRFAGPLMHFCLQGESGRADGQIPHRAGGCE